MRLKYFDDSNLKQMLRVYVGTVRALKKHNVKDKFVARMTGTKVHDVNWAMNEKKFDVQPSDKKDIDSNVKFLLGVLNHDLATADSEK